MASVGSSARYVHQPATRNAGWRWRPEPTPSRVRLVRILHRTNRDLRRMAQIQRELVHMSRAAACRAPSPTKRASPSQGARATRQVHRHGSLGGLGCSKRRYLPLCSQAIEYSA